MSINMKDQRDRQKKGMGLENCEPQAGTQSSGNKLWTDGIRRSKIQHPVNFLSLSLGINFVVLTQNELSIRKKNSHA